MTINIAIKVQKNSFSVGHFSLSFLVFFFPFREIYIYIYSFLLFLLFL